jgi:D-beta-D-heptose 7-phosphate kinase/D-beta-D-heptose 1-phosphate adenosyltransferase
VIFSAQNILVIGDSILDHKIFCKAIGLSLETPTLKVRLEKEEYSFGGAANVVNNLLLLGAQVTFMTPLAQDSHGHHYFNWSPLNLTLKPLLFEGKNVVKSRYWISKGDQSYKYLQINQGTKFQDASLVLNTLKTLLQTNKYDKAILVDYRAGIFEQKEQVAEILNTLHMQHIKTYAASQVSDRESQYNLFEGCGLVCLNQEEAMALVPDFEPTDKKLAQLARVLGARVCVTLGPDGSTLSSPSGATTAPGHKVETVDTCGAGDSFLAALVASGEDLSFSNKWAAASTLQIGTNAPNLEEVLSWQ